jgi:hypothetical protein
MSVHSGNKKRSDLWKRLSLIGLLALSIFPAGAEQKQRRSFGVYSGWSFGLGKVFIDMNSGGHTDNHYMPNFILGAYLQHNFSGSFGLQLNINYQKCSNQWEFNNFDRHEEGTDSIGSFSFSLNGITTVSRSAMTEFYFLGGIGIFAGDFENLGSLIQFSAGTGVKLRVRPGSRTSVNLATVFHHLMYNYGRPRNADYLRLQAGLEFLPKNKQDKVIE